MTGTVTGLSETKGFNDIDRLPKLSANIQGTVEAIRLQGHHLISKDVAENYDALLGVAPAPAAKARAS